MVFWTQREHFQLNDGSTISMWFFDMSAPVKIKVLHHHVLARESLFGKKKDPPFIKQKLVDVGVVNSDISFEEFRVGYMEKLCDENFIPMKIHKLTGSLDVTPEYDTKVLF